MEILLPEFSLGFNTIGKNDPIVWQGKVRAKILDLINYHLRI